MTNSRIAVHDNRFIDFQMKSNSVSIGFCCSSRVPFGCAIVARLVLASRRARNAFRRANRPPRRANIAKGNKNINAVQRAKSPREGITEALRERCVSKEIEIHTSMLIHQNKLADDEHTQVVPRPFYHPPFAVRRRPLFSRILFCSSLNNKQTKKREVQRFRGVRC